MRALYRHVVRADLDMTDITTAELVKTAETRTAMSKSLLPMKLRWSARLMEPTYGESAIS